MQLNSLFSVLVSKLLFTSPPPIHPSYPISSHPHPTSHLRYSHLVYSSIRIYLIPIFALFIHILPTVPLSSSTSRVLHLIQLCVEQVAILLFYSLSLPHLYFDSLTLWESLHISYLSFSWVLSPYNLFRLCHRRLNSLPSVVV